MSTAEATAKITAKAAKIGASAGKAGDRKSVV